jgi:hypothetical protein
MTTFTTEDRVAAYAVPLTDKQILDIYYKVVKMELKEKYAWQITFARLIEEAHNINKTWGITHEN